MEPKPTDPAPLDGIELNLDDPDILRAETEGLGTVGLPADIAGEDPF